jgi:hypothetical protein
MYLGNLSAVWLIDGSISLSLSLSLCLSIGYSMCPPLFRSSDWTVRSRYVYLFICLTTGRPSGRTYQVVNRSAGVLKPYYIRLYTKRLYT